MRHSFDPPSRQVTTPVSRLLINGLLTKFYQQIELYKPQPPITWQWFHPKSISTNIGHVKALRDVGQLLSVYIVKELCGAKESVVTTKMLRRQRMSNLLIKPSKTNYFSILIYFVHRKQKRRAEMQPEPKSVDYYNCQIIISVRWNSSHKMVHEFIKTLE